MLLSTGLGVGGAETQVFLLASGLKRRGWQVWVVSMLPPEGFVEELKAEGVAVYSLHMAPGRPDPRAIWRFARLLQEFRPAILHAHMIHANLLARVSRLVYPVPVLVCTAHSTVEIGRSFRTERSTHLAYRFTDFLCDLTTQVSQEGYRQFLEGKAAKPSKLRFVPNAVDTQRFSPRPDLRSKLREEIGVSEGAFLWLAVGRLEEAKDYPTLLRAFAQVAAEHSAVRLWVVGKGSLEGELQALAHSLGLGDAVRFLGLRKDVSALLNAADAFVMSSAWEGMPMAVLEAHATGLPVVATNVGSIPDVVVPEKTGFLVPPRDPTALALAMKRLMTLPLDERVKMGLKGREWVEARYSLDAIVSEWERVYMGLMDRRRV
ncbi:MAG: glycosyltransferase [Thermus sp.]|uniref:glycosyltransferase n=1 Tax=Thermus sp. TaxID=275 RepID=UPI00391DD793